MDLSDRQCAAHAVSAGGRVKKWQREFLDDFNERFRRVRTEPAELRRMAEFLQADGNEVYVLLENSTITHKVFWILVEADCHVTVAQSADLKRITDSVTKNDDNDAMELAAYMRRRLNGEDEFKVVMMTPPELMAKKMFIRALFVDKMYLGDCKKRVRARIKIMGVDLRRDYKDISCTGSLKQLRETRDPYLCYEVDVMKTTIRRINDGERYIFPMFQDDPNYELILSIPGIGPVLAGYLSTIIVDIGRFDNKKQLESYFGLVPRQHASADSDPDCRTTHFGDEWAREFIGYAVKAHVMHCEDSVVTQMYHRLRARHKPYKKVITACSRKMVDVIWSVLKNGRPFTTDQALLRRSRGAAKEIESEESALNENEIEEMAAEAC